MKVESYDKGMTISELTQDELSHIIVILGAHGLTGKGEMTEQSNNMHNELMLEVMKCANSQGTTRPLTDDETLGLIAAAKLMNKIPLSEEEKRVLKLGLNDEPE